jgi:hypothetical protein
VCGSARTVLVEHAVSHIHRESLVLSENESNKTAIQPFSRLRYLLERNETCYNGAVKNGSANAQVEAGLRWDIQRLQDEP